MKNIIFIFLCASSFLFADKVTEGKQAADRLINSIDKEKINDFRNKQLPSKYDFLPSLIENIEDSKPILTINYLTSSSVPVASHTSFSNYGKKLKEDFNVQSKMCMIGIESDAFQGFITKLMGELSEKGDDTMGMDFCPQIFEDANITKVPAYVVSVCPSSYVHPEECEQRYILKGDVSMKFALEKLAEENKYFKDMYEAL